MEELKTGKCLRGVCTVTALKCSLLLFPHLYNFKCSGVVLGKHQLNRFIKRTSVKGVHRARQSSVKENM